MYFSWKDLYIRIHELKEPRVRFLPALNPR